MGVEGVKGENLSEYERERVNVSVNACMSANVCVTVYGCWSVYACGSVYA